MFDRHEVVISNGAETESLFTGPEALRSIGPAALAEILTLFPGIGAEADAMEPARVLVPGAQARRLAQRHSENGQVLVAG